MLRNTKHMGDKARQQQGRASLTCAAHREQARPASSNLLDTRHTAAYLFCALSPPRLAGWGSTWHSTRSGRPNCCRCPALALLPSCNRHHAENHLINQKVTGSEECGARRSAHVMPKVGFPLIPRASFYRCRANLRQRSFDANPIYSFWPSHRVVRCLYRAKHGSLARG